MREIENNTRISGFNEQHDVHKRMKYVLDMYSYDQLFYLLVQMQIKVDDYDRMRTGFNKLEDECTRAKQEANEIKGHWKTLHDHLEKNPFLKEEWDNFLLAVKLTEDN